MSFYNSSILTRIVRPVYHGNDRCEIRLPDNVYFSNLRLGKLGCVTVGKTDVTYTANTGAKALIKNAHLYSNGKVVESVRDLHLHASFKSLRLDNGRQANMQKELDHTSNGYEVNDSDNLIHSTSLPREMCTNDPATTSESWIDLRTIFAFLNSSPYLNTEKLSNMRLVIEWRNDFQNFHQGDSSAMTACNITEPYLICDQILGEKKILEIQSLTKSGKQQAFVGIDRDFVNIKACANNVTVTDEHKLNAFNNKLVNRLLIVPQDRVAGQVQDATNILKLDRCDGYKDEIYQVILNNQTKFDFNGVSSKRKLAMLIDSFGDITIPLGSEKYAVNRADKLYPNNSIPEAMVGKAGYFGFSVDERVYQLSIKYTRTGFDAHPEFRMNVYAEVLKAIVYTDNGFNIVNL